MNRKHLFLFVLPLLLIAGRAWAAEDSTWLYGTKAQGWPELTSRDLSRKSTVVKLSKDSLWLDEPDMSDLLEAITELGPKDTPQWGERWSKSPVISKYDPLEGSSADLVRGFQHNWYFAFLELRKLRLYEKAGYEAVDMEIDAPDPMTRDNIDFRYCFLLVKKH